MQEFTDRIRDALAGMKAFEGVTGRIELDHAYSDRSPVSLATVRDGKWVWNSPDIARAF